MMALSRAGILPSPLHDGWNRNRLFKRKVLVRLVVSKGKFMGSSFEPNQFEKEDSPPFPKYEIQNFRYDDPNGSLIDPDSTAMAQHQRNGSCLCDDAERHNNGWDHLWNSHASPDLVHVLPCRNHGELVGERKISIDDQC